MENILDVKHPVIKVFIDEEALFITKDNISQKSQEDIENALERIAKKVKEIRAFYSFFKDKHDPNVELTEIKGLIRTLQASDIKHPDIALLLSSLLSDQHDQRQRIKELQHIADHLVILIRIYHEKIMLLKKHKT